jgi:UDP-N-acetylglucosamine 1-carboxyvinyltransferase
MMEQLVVVGGRPIHGEMIPAGNKNEALPCLAASLLTEAPVRIENIPDIADIRTMVGLLETLGCTVAKEDHAVTVGSAVAEAPDLDMARRIRGSFLLAGPLLARRGWVHLPAPGGDRIGRRRVDTTSWRSAPWAPRSRSRSGVRSIPRGLTGTDIFLDEASVMATENAIMAAVRARGTTRIANAASEPHVQGLCRMLVGMGGRIEGIGTNRLEIEGVDALGPFTHRIGPDHIEVGSFIGLAAVTGGELRIRSAGVEHLPMIRLGFERLGVALEIHRDDVLVPGSQRLEIVDDAGGAVPQLDDAPWPGFPADLTSIMVVVATQARGTILIHEKMFESRLFFVDQLQRMGARIILCDPHRVVVTGPAGLAGTQISSPDIRAGMALLIAALAARGESVIQNVHQIDRGYEDIAQRLRALGADVRREPE